MEVKFDVDDTTVKNFTSSAKERLVTQASIYIIEVIEEAKKLEGKFRENGAGTEITDTIILQAVRRNKSPKKTNIKVILLKIFSELLLFIAGIMFLPNMFVDSNGKLNIVYFALYLFVICIAIILCVVNNFLGGD